MIDFLKAKSGNLKLVKRSFDINRLLEAITMFVSQNYKDKSVELIYQINSNVPHYIVGDFRRLGEILINIIEFTYRHTSSGYVKLIVAGFETDRKKMMLEFKIIDSSGGISKHQESKLFVPFHSASSKHGLFLSHVNRVAHFSLEDVDVIKRFDLIFIEHSMITHKILETYNQPKIVQSEEEVLYIEKIKEQFQSHLPSSILNPFLKLKMLLNPF